MKFIAKFFGLVLFTSFCITVIMEIYGWIGKFMSAINPFINSLPEFLMHFTGITTVIIVVIFGILLVIFLILCWLICVKWTFKDFSMWG